MHCAAALRQQIEHSLSARFPATLTQRARVQPDRTRCGIAELDDLFQGGLPAGVVTELVGQNCSGRSTAALAYLAAQTQAGSVCAWIDAEDALDPESAAASGVDLERLLWVRCGTEAQRQPVPLPLPLPLPQTQTQTQTQKQKQTQTQPASVSLQPEAGMQTRHMGGGSPHPRSEGRNMQQAVSALLQAPSQLPGGQTRRQKRAIGTPGAPNRPLSKSAGDREEQVNSDRLPPRRGDNLPMVPRCAESLPNRPDERSRSRHLPFEAPAVFRKGAPARQMWPVLDQALRVADLLLQNGGFSTIVLDLGSVPAEFAWRIPLATWFRFRAACDRTRVSLLLLTQHSCARSSAELVVHLQAGTLAAESSVVTGVQYCAAMQRSRSSESLARVVPIRKPPQPERTGQWCGNAAWAQAR